MIRIGEPLCPHHSSAGDGQFLICAAVKEGIVGLRDLAPHLLTLYVSDVLRPLIFGFIVGFTEGYLTRMHVDAALPTATVTRCEYYLLLLILPPIRIKLLVDTASSKVPRFTEQVIRTKRYELASDLSIKLTYNKPSDRL